MAEEREIPLHRLQRIVRAALQRYGFLSDDSSEDDEGDALVGAPIRPRPHLNSGAVVLELPDDREY
jgi:hypothetical protein